MHLPSFLAGLILGMVLTTYVTVKGFRDRINTALTGLILGSRRKPKGKGKARQVKPRQNNSSGKLYKCLICPESSPRSGMEEITGDTGNSLGWIHPECKDKLSVNQKTFHYGKKK